VQLGAILDGRYPCAQDLAEIRNDLTALDERGLLIENFGVTEERVTRKELVLASGAAAISSLREIQVIKSIDGKDFPSSRELRELQESFSIWVLGNLLS
jgi:hypothetical protein